jgi:hypothetical protein
MLRSTTIACALPRDLFNGPPDNGHVRLSTDARFTVVKRDTRGKIAQGLELR